MQDDKGNWLRTEQVYQMTDLFPEAPEESFGFSCEVGAVVCFGNYEQDDDKSNGTESVEWIVLDVDQSENRALLLSKYVLDLQRYNKKWTKVSWAKCSSRSWLNGTFYDKCFTADEQEYIIKTALLSYYVDGYIDTKDNVFFLNEDELTKYLPSRDDRKAVPTDYAISQEVVHNGGYSYWWLRDSSQRKNDANRIEPDGHLQRVGANTNAYGVGVRPAIWVDLALFK